MKKRKSNANKVPSLEAEKEDPTEQKLKAATDDYNKMVAAWEKKHSARILIIGSFAGDNFKSGLQVVLKPKKS